MGRPRKDNLRTTPKVKVRTKKQRTFTGCDTCRKLKIKCDGRRPAPCLRCEKSHRTCLGYDLKLKFSKPVVLSNDGILGTADAYEDGSDGPSSRTLIPFVEFPQNMSYRSFDEMDVVLEKLAEEKFSGEPIVSGPFTVFAHSWDDTEHRLKKLQDKEKDAKVSGSGEADKASSMEEDQRLLEERKIKSRKNLSTLLKYSLNDGVSYSGLQSRIPKRSNILSNPLGINFPNQKLWIHPSLKNDALVTYKTKLGNANINIGNDWQNIKHVIFEEHFGFSQHLSHKITDKFNKDQKILELISFERLKETILLLNHVATRFDISTLLSTSSCQNLIHSFPMVAQSIFPLSFSNDISQAIILPSFYRVAGEMLLTGSAFAFKEAANSSDKFLKTVKETFVLEALALTALSKFKDLNQESAEYTKYFQCFINFREIMLINLSHIIMALIVTYQEGDILKIHNTELLSHIMSAGLLKELLFAINLALTIDEKVNIIQNFKILFEVGKGICEYANSTGFGVDREVENILAWCRFRYALFKSTSTIDIKNYVIDEEGYEDLDENYNLISSFKFSDSFKSTEVRKIEIQSSTVDIEDIEDIENDNDNENDDDYANDLENDDEDENANMFVNEASAFDDTIVGLPSRLAVRPDIEDKPPRRFTVRFSYDKDEEDDDEEDENDDGNTSDTSESSSDECLGVDRVSPSSLSSSMLSVSNSTKNGKNNSGAGKVDSLTGLGLLTKPMSLSKREQLGSKEVKHLVDIKLPFNINDNEVNLLELGYGIPTSLIDLVERTVLLADHRNWFMRKQIFPRNFPKFCCDLEEDLMNWSLPWNLFYSAAGENTTINEAGEVCGAAMEFHSGMHEALYHSVICHYNCILLYFYRLVKDTDPSLLQGHVISTLTHMESLFDLACISRQNNAATGLSGQFDIRPSFWCFLIAGSDAIDPAIQMRFDRLAKMWFSKGEKWIGKQMVYECFRTRNMETSFVPGVDYEGVELNDEDDPVLPPNNGFSKEDEDEEKEISWLDVVKGWQLAGY